MLYWSKFTCLTRWLRKHPQSIKLNDNSYQFVARQRQTFVIFTTSFVAIEHYIQFILLFLDNMENLKHFLSQLNGKGAKIFQDFCESTSLHGYSYLYIAQSKVLKVFWVIVLITMTSLGIVFLVDNTMDYIKADVVTTIKSFTANLSVSTIILKHSSGFLRRSL